MPVKPEKVIGEVVQLIDTNKARLAFLGPVISAVIIAVGNFVVTGEIDATEIQIAIGGVTAGIAAGVPTYFGSAGRGVVEVDPVE
jgi:hypothetical protein